MKRTLWTLATLLILLVLIAGHIYYWYLPRERPGRPAAESLASQLMAEEQYDVALWMPYPHQNLGQLYRTAGVESEAFSALARLVRLPAPEIPAFGPMQVPPASELVVVASEDEGKFAVCAKVYPLFASFARLSGRLADNPWLAGGEIYIEGRRLEIAWQGNWWIAASPEFPDLSQVATSPATADREPEALAIVHARRPLHPLPGGEYYLRRQDGGLEVVSRSATPGPDPFAGLGLSEHEIFLLLMAARRPGEDEPAQAMAFFPLDDVDLAELPRVVAVHGPGNERWELPGENILQLAGRRAETAVVGPWTVSALDSPSLDIGRHLAPHLAALLAGGADGAPASDEVAGALSSGTLHWGLWLDLGEGLAEVSRIAQLLEQVPIVPRSEIQRWNDFETVLDPLSRHFSHLTVEVAGTSAEIMTETETPVNASLRLRLEPLH